MVHREELEGSRARCPAGLRQNYSTKAKLYSQGKIIVHGQLEGNVSWFTEASLRVIKAGWLAESVTEGRQTWQV